MGMIITNSDWEDVAEISEYSIDMAFGDDENDFLLTCKERLSVGCLCYLDGTEFGGIIDGYELSVSSKVNSISYRGRTWHGILSGAIVKPPVGSSHRTVSGDAASVIQAIINAIGMGEIFEAGDSQIIIESQQIPRYIDAYSALRRVLASANAVLTIEKIPGGPVILDARQQATFSNEVDDDIVSFAADREVTHVNHLICLGQGQGSGRTVIELYANTSGVISTSKSISGAFERTAVYENTNADATNLEAEGREKLSELQVDGTINVNLAQTNGICVGDSIEARSNEYGITVLCNVTKKIISIVSGVTSIDYEVGVSSWDTEYE